MSQRRAKLMIPSNEDYIYCPQHGNVPINYPRYDSEPVYNRNVQPLKSCLKKSNLDHVKYYRCDQANLNRECNNQLTTSSICDSQVNDYNHSYCRPKPINYNTFETQPKSNAEEVFWNTWKPSPQSPPNSISRMKKYTEFLQADCNASKSTIKPIKRIDDCYFKETKLQDTATNTEIYISNKLRQLELEENQIEETEIVTELNSCDQEPLKKDSFVQTIEPFVVERQVEVRAVQVDRQCEEFGNQTDFSLLEKTIDIEAVESSKELVQLLVNETIPDQISSESTVLPMMKRSSFFLDGRSSLKGGSYPLKIKPRNKIKPKTYIQPLSGISFVKKFTRIGINK